jgi:ABC-type nickel/cobalt efflux system permease component RcnA
MTDPEITKPPIVVAADPTMAQAETLIGQLVPALGGIVIAFGVLTTEKWAAVAGLLPIVLSGVWRVWRTTRNQSKLRALAQAAPDDVGHVRPKR